MAKQPGHGGFPLLDGDEEPILGEAAGDEEKNELSLQEIGRKHGGWRAMPYIIGNEMFERVASFGLTANLTVYLVKEYQLKKVHAVTTTQVWNGTTSFVPLLGAYLADAYWGKFKTLAWACVATLLGMAVMTLTASVPALKPRSCGANQPSQCERASRSQMGVLILALGLLTLGAAGVRPCNLPFGMDQFDRSTESGRKAVHSYFNWYYTTNALAVLVGITVLVYLQDNVSWSIGFGASALLMLLAILVFLLGSRMYVRIPPEGSIFSGIAKVLVNAFKKRSLHLPSPSEQQATLYNGSISNPCNPTATCNNDSVLQLPLTQQFRFMNKAAIKVEGEVDPDSGELLKPWRLSTVQRVEEVKCLIRVIPIWVSAITCMIALAQLFTYAVLQSLTMERHIGAKFEIPAASVAVIPLVAIVLFLPIYDRVIVPVLRRWRRWSGTARITRDKEEGGISLLQRMGVGIAISAASMVVAGIVERRRRNMALHANGGESPMSVLWLVPQLALVGVSEGFNAVGQIEFYNQQFPDQMRSLATSLFSCSIAASHYVSSIVVAIVHKHTHDPNWLDDDINEGRLDYFYYLLALMGGLDLLYFLVIAHFYKYKGEWSSTPCSSAECNEKREKMLPQGRRGEGVTSKGCAVNGGQVVHHTHVLGLHQVVG